MKKTLFYTNPTIRLALKRIFNDEQEGAKTFLFAVACRLCEVESEMELQKCHQPLLPLVFY